MNRIYLINNDFNYEVILNFINNTFEKDNILYKFEFIDYNKILISVDNIEYIYYTEDSYLYFSDIQLKNKIKKIFLIHSEWHDQVILNIEDKILHRIVHNTEFGKFNFDGNNLIIDWNHWGKEHYIKEDEYTYIQSNYISLIPNPNYNKIPIHIFIHVCMIENWENIFIEQLNIIKSSGLYNIVEKIHLGLLGDYKLINEDIFNDEKIEILYIDKRIELYEIHTINFVKSFCENLSDEAYILYIHTKGVRKAGNKETIDSWRNMMQYFLIENFKLLLSYLYIFDAIGNNLINMHCYNKNDVKINIDHTYHYSGNFWWSKKTYINKLNYIPLDLTQNSINTRYRAENWILSNSSLKNIGIVFQDDTNLHPYHRYIFDYYKKMSIIIKNGNR